MMYYSVRIFHSLTLLACIFATPWTASVDAQERPDTVKLSSEALAAAQAEEDYDQPREEKQAISPIELRAQRMITIRARRLPKRSKRLRRVLGRRGQRYPATYASMDGFGNNRLNFRWGRAQTAFSRLAPAKYTDGISEPLTEKEMPSARSVSNNCFDQSDDLPNRHRATDFLWQWGQFLDHDITLTPVNDPEERYMISIPRGDRFFDPQGTGTKQMKLTRSAFLMSGGVRQQVNNITAFIDASNVYGSDDERALALRTLDDTGRLKESDGRMLPFNTENLENDAMSAGPEFFLAGDPRANEQVGLTAMHTLFVREHNYWAEYLRRAFRQASGERIYQMARGIVSAEMQVITYNEFLPALLGEQALPAYTGYKPEVDPTISNEFAAAAYRFGHTMLSPFLARIDKSGRTISQGHLLLRDAFFQPKRLINEGGVDPVLRGLASRPAQAIDLRLIDDVRNFLFGPPGAGGFDLASLNIQRSRDHGLSSYNVTRQMLGLSRRSSFEQFSSNPDVVACLRSTYRSVDDVDLWVGGLSEDHASDAMVGETILAILKDQFIRLRDGDRFWYQNYLPRKLRKIVAGQTLARIIRRNTGISSEIQNNVFKVKN